MIYRVSSKDLIILRRLESMQYGFYTIEEALAAAEKEIGKVESVIVMPEGSLTVPRVEE